MSEEIQKSDPEMEYWPPTGLVLPEEEEFKITWKGGPDQSGKVFTGRLDVSLNNLVEKVTSFFRVYQPDLEEWGYWKDYQVQSPKEIVMLGRETPYMSIAILARKVSYVFKEGMSPPPIRPFSVERTIESDHLYPVMEFFIDHPYISIHYDYNHERGASLLAKHLVNRFAITPHEIASQNPFPSTFGKEAEHLMVVPREVKIPLISASIPGMSRDTPEEGGSNPAKTKSGTN